MEEEALLVEVIKRELVVVLEVVVAPFQAVLVQVEQLDKVTQVVMV